MMHIRKLTVDSAATVSIPVTPLNPMGEFTVDIESVTVNGNGVQMDSRCLIKGGVEIKGHIGKFSFASIGGSLNIVGDNNSVSVENDITGNVGWNAVNGSLLIRGKCANLNVTTTNAVIDINSVIGVNGAEMQTVSGNLHINEITGGGLQFTATGLASVSVGRVNGAVRIPEMGLGTVDLSNVRGNVDITSVKTNAGGITVSFDNTITANPTVKILGYDGDISVSNIRGDTDIAVRDFQNGTANANIYTHFLRVSLNVIITANMGYVAGHTDRANITVDLDTPIWGILDIIGTAYAENQNAAQIYIRNTVDSISTFWLQDWSVIESSPVSDDAFWTIVENAVGHSVLHSHIRVQTATKFFLK
jgi:hypothetical protein